MIFEATRYEVMQFLVFLKIKGNVISEVEYRFSNNGKIEMESDDLETGRLNWRLICIKVCLGDAFVYGFPNALLRVL